MQRSVYSKAQERELSKIKPQPGIGKVTGALAIKWGMQPANVYAKWNALQKKVKGPNTLLKGVLAPDKAATVTAPVFKFKFEAIENFHAKSKTDPNEQAALEQALDVIVPQMINKRGFKVPKKFMGRAKAYLENKYPQDRFTFSTGRAVPEGLMVIARRTGKGNQ